MSQLIVRRRIVGWVVVAIVGLAIIVPWKQLFLQAILPTDETPLAYPSIDCQLRNWPAADAATSVARVHLFTTGEDKLTRVMTGRREWWTPIQAFVIERTDGELIVIDPGPDRQRFGFLKDWTYNGLINHLIVPIRLGASDDLPDQMAAAGLSVDTVTTVVLTHAHGDHTGNLDMFPSATVVIDAREKAQAEQLGSRSGAVPKELAAVTNWREVNLAETPPVASYEHGLDVAGDGSIWLVEADGHTPGQLSVVVRTADGPVLIPGDALARWDDLEQHRAMPGQDDRERFLLHLAMAECFSKRDPSLVILPAHDEPRDATARNPSITVHARPIR